MSAYQVRVGISTGPLVAGVLGVRPIRFTFIGDTVNVAARMESTGRPSAVHLSSETWAELLAHGYEPSGLEETRLQVEVKGKGQMQTTLISQRSLSSGRLWEAGMDQAPCGSYPGPSSMASEQPRLGVGQEGLRAPAATP